MKINNEELFILKKSIFMLLVQLESNVVRSLNKDKVDSQAIFALTKLVDSFLKLNFACGNQQKNDDDNISTKVIGDDLQMLEVYGCKTKKVMAPRAGLEPATERLTAACSTTELPGNNI